ncbi:MAG: alanine racemase [Myxococcota bacterium]
MNDLETLRPTHAVVDLDALEHNLKLVRQRVAPRPMMAIVKANAYGHGLVETARAMADMGVDAFGVAFLEEGIALRHAGVAQPILVLGGLIGNQIEAFILADLSMTASSVYKVRQIDEVGRRLGRSGRVHLKVDTGMGRIGMQWDTAHQLIEASLSARHCQIEGIFSHFSSSEASSQDFTRLQLRRFREVLGLYAAEGRTAPCAHIANSGAVLQHPESWLDMVRPGLLLYGIAPAPHLRTILDLRPVLSLHTRVVFFKVQRAGRSVSYDETFVPAQDTRIVTLPVGYGDGYSRRLSNRGEVLIRGRRYPVVGRVTMDAVMVDIGPEGTAYNGDPVVLMGRDGSGPGITAEELSGWMDTIPYEMLAGINARVPRRYASARRSM